LFNPDHLYLLGHSLGGARATHIAEQDFGIAGLVLLGSAQATRTAPNDKGRNMNRADAQSILNVADLNLDGMLTQAELSAKPSTVVDLTNHDFELLDFDDDGVLRIWEVSAGLAWNRRNLNDGADIAHLHSQSLRWTEDILTERSIPTLFVYGSLDFAQAHHAPVLQRMVDSGQLRLVTVVVLPDVGHQLGPELEGRVGPIDTRTLRVITSWLDDRVSKK
jgi:pimeloyl-ACP methyl ester carboxylesterase